MAGMTHMQHAQPILLSHFLLAHAEAFTRDVTRLQNAAASADACPMGSGALAGNSFASIARAIACELGFSKITANSLDAVSDRDFALDYLFALSGVATHFRASPKTSSSLRRRNFLTSFFPTNIHRQQPDAAKENPDCWELIRGKTGRITGALVGLLTTLKDFRPAISAICRRTKKPFFSAHDQVDDMLAIATGAIKATAFRDDRLRSTRFRSCAACHRSADIWFARAYHFARPMISSAKSSRKPNASKKLWTELPLDELRRISPAFAEDFATGLTIEGAVGVQEKFRWHRPGIGSRSDRRS